MIFSDDMCSLFVVNRAAAAYQSAHARAMRCMAAYPTECMLSPEIGLAMPAAFLYDHNDGLAAHAHRAQADPARIETRMHVRVSPPDSDGITQTRTLVLNETVRVEYLDGQSKGLGSEPPVAGGGVLRSAAAPRVRAFVLGRVGLTTVR